MNISFEEIGQVLVTCQTDEGVEAGKTVKISGNGKAGPCAAGEQVCGVAVETAQDGYAAIQVKGFIGVPCKDSTVSAGWAELTADGAGGVKKAGTGDKGRGILVMSVEEGQAVVCL